MLIYKKIKINKYIIIITMLMKTTVALMQFYKATYQFLYIALSLHIQHEKWLLHTFVSCHVTFFNLNTKAEII